MSRHQVPTKCGSLFGYSWKPLHQIPTQGGRGGVQRHLCENREAPKHQSTKAAKQQSSKAARRVRSTVMAKGCPCWSSKHESMGALVTDSMARQKLLAFGAYPAVFLAKARQRKDQAREQLADGVDPRADQEFEARVVTIERGRGATGDRVRLLLRTMKPEGLIDPTGKGRGARWASLAVNPATGAKHHKTGTQASRKHEPMQGSLLFRDFGLNHDLCPLLQLRAHHGLHLFRGAAFDLPTHVF